MDLLLATRNPHKTREFRQLLGKNFKLIDLTALPEVATPEETGRTFKENATLKAIAASKKLPSLVVADDSGLEVDALEGARSEEHTSELQPHLNLVCHLLLQQ